MPVSAHFIAAGQTIGYEGTSAGNNAVSATRLWLFGLPQVHGTVSAINSNTLTLQTAQGTSVTITLSPNTTYVQAGKSASTATPTTVNAQAVHMGAKVNIVANGTTTSGSPTAVLVVVM